MSIPRGMVQHGVRQTLDKTAFPDIPLHMLWVLQYFLILRRVSCLSRTSPEVLVFGFPVLPPSQNNTWPLSMVLGTHCANPPPRFSSVLILVSLTVLPRRTWSGQRMPTLQISGDCSPREENLTFFRAPEKRIFLFSCGATPSRIVNKTQPLEVAFSLQERVDLRSQKEGSFGEENCLGKGGVDRAKKGKKGCAKGGGKPDLLVEILAH